MLKQELEFVDPFGDGEEKLKETFYFNLTMPELVELNFTQEEGLQGFLKRIMEEEDVEKILGFFKLFILKALGERDGVHHIKSDLIRERFTMHPAYPVLYMRMIEDEKFAADFIMGTMPKQLVEAYKADQEKKDQDKPVGPPPVPGASA